jgi:hypothetical protein
MILEIENMDEWEIQQQSSQFKMWVTASIFQRPEHIASTMRYHAHMWNKIHVCAGRVWDSIPVGCTSFFEIYCEIKKFERRYPDCAQYYSIILKSKKGADIKTNGYFLGCKIHYNAWTGEIKLSHCCRNVPVFTMLLKTARQYGGVFQQEQPTQEEAFANARKRMLIKRVLSSNSY